MGMYMLFHRNAVNEKMSNDFQINNSAILMENIKYSLVNQFCECVAITLHNLGIRTSL